MHARWTLGLGKLLLQYLGELVLIVGTDDVGRYQRTGQRVADAEDTASLNAGHGEDHGLDPLSFRWLTLQTQYRSEMDFTWEAMETADQRVKQLRRRVADWAPGSTSLGEAARTFDARFRSALADDLSMPGAVVVVNELTSSPGVPAGEKYSLLAAWDEVLGLDLEREARSSWEPTDEVRALMTERDVARAAKEYGKSDELRDRLAGMGLEVMDTTKGTRVRPRD